MKECNSCGKCCINYSNGDLHASDDDIKFWELFRPEIAAYVTDGKIWMDPESGQQIELCPWLEKEGNKYTCSIYHDRPEDCRIYPVNIAEMIKDECEMLESKDLKDPVRAQNILEKM